MYAFQSEFKLFSCLNFKEFFACGRRDIWRLSDSIGIRAYIDLVHKRALNNLAKDVGSNPIAVTGNFVVKTKPGSFNAVSANMKLEQTIQREKKKRERGIVGQTRKASHVMEWELSYHKTLAIDNVYHETTSDWISVSETASQTLCNCQLTTKIMWSTRYCIHQRKRKTISSLTFYKFA